MNPHFKFPRNVALVIVTAVTAIAWGVAELIALQRAHRGGLPRR